jgi:hypothetical protein
MVMLTLVPIINEALLATVKSVPALPPSVKVLDAPVPIMVTVPADMVKELNEKLAPGPVVKVKVPAVLKTTSSPVTGAVPPLQFAGVVQFKVAPAPAVQVFTAAKLPVATNKFAKNITMAIALYFEKNWIMISVLL